MDNKDPPKEHLSPKEKLDLQIAIVKQETLNEALKLKSDMNLQEIEIGRHILRTRTECSKVIGKAKKDYDLVTKRLTEMEQKMKRVRKFVNSDKFFKIQAMIQAQIDLKKQKEKEKDLRKIEWNKNQIDLFKAFPGVAKLNAKKNKATEILKIYTEKSPTRREKLQLQQDFIVKRVLQWTKEKLALENAGKEKLALENSGKEKTEVAEVRKDDSDNEEETETTDTFSSFSLKMNFKAAWSFSTAIKKPRPSYENENRRRSEPLKRPIFDSSSEEEFHQVKRVRFNSNDSYRSPTPDLGQTNAPSTSTKSPKKVVAVPVPKITTPNPVMPKSPKKVATVVQEPVFKVPSDPPPTKGILKKQKKKAHSAPKLEKFGNLGGPAMLTRTRSSRDLARTLSLSPKPVEKEPQPLKPASLKPKKSMPLAPLQQQNAAKSPDKPKSNTLSPKSPKNKSPKVIRSPLSPLMKENVRVTSPGADSDSGGSALDFLNEKAPESNTSFLFEQSNNSSQVFDFFGAQPKGDTPGFLFK